MPRRPNRLNYANATVNVTAKLANILQTDSGEDSVNTLVIDHQSIQFYIGQLVGCGV